MKLLYLALAIALLGGCATRPTTGGGLYDSCDQSGTREQRLACHGRQS